MAITVLTNPKIQINSVDLSNHITTVTLEETYADVDTTAFGSTSKTRMAGLGDHKVTLNFQQDFAAASVDATISALVGSTTTIIVTPVNTTVSTSNPSRTFTVLINDWKSIDGKIGDLLMASVTWPISGAVTKSNT